jgi:hypothetical protein
MVHLSIIRIKCVVLQTFTSNSATCTKLNFQSFLTLGCEVNNILVFDDSGFCSHKSFINISLFRASSLYLLSPSIACLAQLATKDCKKIYFFSGIVMRSVYYERMANTGFVTPVEALEQLLCVLCLSLGFV